MTKVENRGLTAREAVLAYCTHETQFKYIGCWPSLHEVALDATSERIKRAHLAVDREMMAMLRHEVPEQDDTASAPDQAESRKNKKIHSGRLPRQRGKTGKIPIIAGLLRNGNDGISFLRVDAQGAWRLEERDGAFLGTSVGDGPYSVKERFIITRENGDTCRLAVILQITEKTKRVGGREEIVKRAVYVGNTVEPWTPPTFSNEKNLARMLDGQRKVTESDAFAGPVPVLLWVTGRPGDGMPPREVTQDELRHLRLYPERDELSGGGLRFVGLLFFNAAGRRLIHETKGVDNAAPEAGNEAASGCKKGGPPTKRDDICRAFTALVNEGIIGRFAPWKKVYPVVRERVLAAPHIDDDDQRGLSDKTIERVIGPSRPLLKNPK